MKERLPLVLSATALAVALFGATPLGEAARQAIPPLAKHAKTSGHAKTAGYAKYAGNAATVNAIKAARTPKPGYLVPLGPDGKFPEAVGAIGPQGPKGEDGEKGEKGDPGPQGSPGISNLQRITGSQETLIQGATRIVSATCPAGQRALGGGFLATDTWGMKAPEVTFSRFTSDGTGWEVQATNHDLGSKFLRAYAVCATVAS